MKSRWLCSLLACAAPAVHQAFVPPTSPVVLWGSPVRKASIAKNPSRSNDVVQDNSRLHMKKGYELFDLFYDDLGTASSA